MGEGRIKGEAPPQVEVEDERKRSFELLQREGMKKRGDGGMRITWKENGAWDRAVFSETQSTGYSIRIVVPPSGSLAYLHLVNDLRG